jgi:hypothetical protein
MLQQVHDRWTEKRAWRSSRHRYLSNISLTRIAKRPQADEIARQAEDSLPFHGRRGSACVPSARAVRRATSVPGNPNHQRRGDLAISMSLMLIIASKPDWPVIGRYIAPSVVGQAEFKLMQSRLNYLGDKERLHTNLRLHS